MITHSTLDAAYGVALIASGNVERGQRMFQALIERLRASGEHTPAFLMHEYRVKAARLVGDGQAVREALKEMREAALASGNPSAILLADSVSQLRAGGRSSQLPPSTLGAGELATFSETHADATVVTEFLRGEQLFQRRAEHALQLLGQCASSNEVYLFWFKDGVLELKVSLDHREPPDALFAALSALPANDQTLALPHDPNCIYRVVRLANDADTCLGIAAIGGTTPAQTFPEPLVADIGRALAESAATAS